MIYTDHNGKAKRVSEKRFNAFASRPENKNEWLEFRVKVFGFPKEDLIMHPSSNMIIRTKNGTLAAVGMIGEMYYACLYGKGRITNHVFNTPQEAYDFAYNL